MDQKSATPNLTDRQRLIVSLALTFVVVALLFLLYYLNISLLYKWAGAIILLAIMSRFMIGINGFDNLYIAYMLGSTWGIATIDALSKRYSRWWIALADWGIVISLGLLSLLFFRKQINRKTFIVGILSIVVLIVILPLGSALALNFVQIPQITSKVSAQPVNPASASLAFYVASAVSIIGGFASLVFLSTIYSAFNIIYAIVVFIVSVSHHAPNYTVINSQVPGVAPLLPGVTLPLFAGIVTLAILLFVHEFCHGILARIANVEIKRVGLLLYGLIPVGAFVEPDEAQVIKLKKSKQNRIFIAGVAANLIVAIIFFLLLIAFVRYVLPGFVTSALMITATLPNSPSNIIPAGARIIKWNGYAVSNITAIEAINFTNKPFSTISVLTDKGLFNLTTNQSGKIGVFITQEQVPQGGLAGSTVYFVYAVLALSFFLNFLVGLVNLIPLPGLDGWRVYQLEIKNKKILSFLAALIFIAILVNALPWVWNL